VGVAIKEPSRDKNEPNAEGKVVVLSRGKPGVSKKKRNGGSAKGAQKDSVATLKQELFEASRDLDKEKNTRNMLENKVASLSNELKNIKEKLGEDKHYCMSSMKEELDFEQKLRISVQHDLAVLEQKTASEQNKVRVLENEVKMEKIAKQSIQSQLQETKEELASEKARQHSIQTNLLLETQKTQLIQKRMQCEAAANIAVRMELQSIKRERGRVEDLEKKLKLERSTSDHCKIEAAEYSAIRMELNAAKQKLRNMKKLEKGLKQESNASIEAHAHAEELTQPILTLKQKDVENDKERLIRKLRRDLHQAREMLKSERKKNISLTPQSARKKAPKPSLSDWVNVAPTSNQQHAGLIPIIQASSSTNMPPPVETSLPGSCAAASLLSAPTVPSLFHFEDDDASVLCDKELEPLHDELTFLRSAYDQDEIVIEGNKVVHMIELSTGYDEVISLALAVLIPSNYPASGVLGVKASIQGSSNCSHEVRKCAIDALPKLEEICMWEARANEGREAIHPVFSVASGWANTDWHNILSKELSLSIDKHDEFNGTLVESCIALIHSHHIIEADKIQCVKKNASKLSLGGFIKIGRPGLILVEGSEADCDQMMEALAQSKKIFHSNTFKCGAKVRRNVIDIDSGRCLPRKIEELENKIGMDELSCICEKLGLLQPLNDIISH